MRRELGFFSEPTLRAFIALELESDVRARLAQSLPELGRVLAGVRLVPADSIHLTLRFLGPSRPAQLERLKTSLAAAAAGCPPLPARVAGAGMFPERGAPRVLWIGLTAAAELLALQAACERAARAAGFAPEHRPFRPHLTVGRFRERVERKPLPALELGETKLRSLVLFESELRREGARHTPLATFALAGRS